MGTSSPDSPTKRVAFVEYQRRFCIHVGSAGNDRSNFSAGSIQPAVSPSEGAAEDAFLHPRSAFGQFSIGRQAGEFGAGASAARRTVIGFTRALDKVA